MGGYGQLPQGDKQAVVSSRSRVERALARVAADPLRSDLCFLGLDANRARRDADAIDAGGPVARSGSGRLAGMPTSIKDLFDVAGEVTKAGSVVLSRRPAAARDADIVVRMRQAGMILLGRTNMTEFAYSGLGLNPHFGTPGNAHDVQRIPGGSSSGAGVAVACGLSELSVATDTSGSVRVPAAFNGVVGFKASALRYPSGGVIPLSRTQDAIGLLARSVALCADADAALSVIKDEPPIQRRAGPLRLAVPKGFLLDDLDGPTATAFSAALTRLSAAGCEVHEVEVAALGLVDQIGLGGIVGPEAYAWHRRLLQIRPDEYDPRVRVRIEAAAPRLACDYLDCLALRDAAMVEIDRASDSWDALLCPTTPGVAPRFDAIVDDGAYLALNSRALRNTYIFNILDLPAISLPCHDVGTQPVGLMVVGKRSRDRDLLSVARVVEKALGSGSGSDAC